MIEAMHEAGTQVLKFRGGMPYNAPFRVGGFYRLTNMLALLDVAVRGVEPDECRRRAPLDSDSGRRPICLRATRW